MRLFVFLIVTRTNVRANCKIMIAGNDATDVSGMKLICWAQRSEKRLKSRAIASNRRDDLCTRSGLLISVKFADI